MVSIALYPIFGKPFVLYLGVLTLTSYLVTAALGFSYYRGWLQFKWHPAMVVVSFIFAVLMTLIGLSLHKPLVGILGLLTLFSFVIAAVIGVGIHQRQLNIRFIWHPVVVVIAIIFAVLHGLAGIMMFI
ncbi:MAG: hypothetical protein NKF70_12760 [Methanobacterium sp. ERen5]|nr:MAG: hypothetical protein NKF70_12760 [Methanobacterium sp. ERen5]